MVIHLVSNWTSPIPTIGASGAIAGVMGAYFVLYPLARILVLVPVFFYPVLFEVYAVFFIGLWFLMQFYAGAITSIVASGDSGGIAWWAHVGGFVVGMVLVLLLKKRKPLSGKLFRSGITT